MMRILQIASEMAPIAKVGGLADVILGLSRELQTKGHDVSIMIPKYDCLDYTAIKNLKPLEPSIKSTYRKEHFHSTIWTGLYDTIPIFLVDLHHPHDFFKRGCFYGCEDDMDRFLAFSRVSLDYILKSGVNPDIVHLHDWQTAAIAPLVKILYPKNSFKIVHTIHNLEYQGKCAPFNLDWIGLKGKDLLNPEKMGDPYSKNLINLLKGAIVYSDYLTTVSPNYAWEVTTPEGGRGLDPFLRKYIFKFEGVLNGLDYSYWDPQIDFYLLAHYSSRETPSSKRDRATLDKKEVIKSALRERLQLEQSKKPIVGCVARLVPQKGIELIKHALERTLEKGGQFVLLGTSPIPSITAEFHDLKVKYLDNPNVHLVLHHQEELAHQIYAGSDIFIVPSLFEPCGLTQLISLRYGAIPVVRKTGGLADTIADIDYSPRPAEERNGFVFDYPDNIGLDSALDRALNMWFNDQEKWHKLMIQGMNMDFSWNKPAEKYVDIYKRA